MTIETLNEANRLKGLVDACDDAIDGLKMMACGGAEMRIECNGKKVVIPADMSVDIAMRIRCDLRSFRANLWDSFLRLDDKPKGE